MTFRELQPTTQKHGRCKSEVCAGAAQDFRIYGMSTSVGIDELDQALEGVMPCTVFGSKLDVEILRDHFREGNEIHRGYAGIKEAGIQILRQIYWLPIYLEVFVDLIPAAISG